MVIRSFENKILELEPFMYFLSYLYKNTHLFSSKNKNIGQGHFDLKWAIVKEKTWKRLMAYSVVTGFENYFLF